jgi:hypothetical protein
MTQETEQVQQDDEVHLTTKEVAKRLRLNVVTLANWRVQGKGPMFIKAGRRVLYPIDQLQVWEKGQLRQNTAVA